MPATATSSIELTDEDFDFLAEDLPTYAEVALVVRPKEGDPRPLHLNASQRYVHERLEAQRRETGKVRALICKGRQQGISTYVGARFYWRVTHRRGARAFILTHEIPATYNLFGMTKRYHENCLDELRPATGSSNANELTFPGLDSGYKVATAGGIPVGRSETLQYVHGSEVAYWPNAAANLQGLLEAVPPGDDTEVILESTAKEPGDAFHSMWKAAKAGQSEFIAIFVPWHVHEEYRTEPPEGWEPPKAFLIYEQANGLERAQTYWAFLKNRDMANARALPADEICIAFKREYPASDLEAFENAGDDLLRVIPLEWLRAAQARWVANKDKPKGKMTGLGGDVAQGGGDRSVLAPWYGVRLEALKTVPGELTKDGPAFAGVVVSVVRDDAVVGLDLGGGWGGGALSHLKQLGDDFKRRCFGVNPSAKSEMISKEGGFKMRNMRAALHWAFREALDPESGEDIEIPPDIEGAIEELAAATWENTPSGILIEDKDDIIKRLKRSPDEGDAIILGWWATRKHATLKAREARTSEGDAIGGGGSWMG